MRLKENAVLLELNGSFGLPGSTGLVPATGGSENCALYVRLRRSRGFHLYGISGSHQSVVRVSRDCWSRSGRKTSPAASLTSFRCGGMSSGVDDENLRPTEAASPCNGQDKQPPVADGHCSPATDTKQPETIPKGTFIRSLHVLNPSPRQSRHSRAI